MGLNVLVLKNFRLFADVTIQDLLTLVNQERQREGLTPLAENTKLDQAAFLKAQDMISNDYFAHYSPQGTSPWYWFDQAGYYYQYAGENLAMNFFDSQEAVTAWMNSPLHRENILNKNYTETGIAVIKSKTPNSDEEKIILVQTFGSQLKSKLASVKTVSTTKPSQKVTSRTTTTTIRETTTTLNNVTTTIPTEVLGLTENNTKLPPSDIRTEKEVVEVIKQTVITDKQREELGKLEFQRTALSNNVPEKTWFQYHATAIFNNNIFKLINQSSGVTLIFLSTVGLFSIGKSREFSFGTRKILYTRNAILGAMGAGFLIIQPTILFGSTIIPKVLK